MTYINKYFRAVGLGAGSLGTAAREKQRVKVQGGQGVKKISDEVVALIKRDGEIFPYKEVAVAYNVPVSYVAKIMQGLIRVKVESAPWPEGIHFKGAK